MKQKIGLFFGGMGNEADVSIISAQNVAENFDHKKYKLVLVYWHKNGQFYLVENFSQIMNPKKLLQEKDFRETFDIALPMTHGRFGEDGILQAIFERYGIKYCGCRVLSSAICMDKAVCKTFLTGHNIKQTKFLTLDIFHNKSEIEKRLELIRQTFKLPLFVKPANSGSSVGITMVKNFKDLGRAISAAAKHDKKIIIEEGLDKPREIEIGILGNEDILISQPGELKFSEEFYDYDEKYRNNKTDVQMPAKLKKSETEQIRKVAEKIYRLCDCSGFARLDFFVAKNKIYFNEINTLPGFTKFSMYPMLMMNSGLSYKRLINKIIELSH